MPLEITYWTKSGANANQAGSVISSEQRTVSGTSAQSTATPHPAKTVSIYATEAARFEYAANPTASSASAYIGAGERLWIDAGGGNKIAGITA